MSNLPDRETPQKLATLRALRKKWRDCVSCGLCESRKQIVFADGEPEARVMLIGEGPGEQEDAEGVPFVGRSGVLLDELLRRAGATRTEVHIVNAVLCKPPDNRPPNNEELAACRPRLLEHVRILDPDVIIAMGKTALKTLTGRKNAAITTERGKLFDVTIPGLHLPLSYPVMPAYHPTYLLRNPDQSPGGLVYQTVSDLRDAFVIADVLNHRWRGVPLPNRKPE